MPHTRETGAVNTRRLGLIAAWLAGTALAVILASQAVALVRDQVTDRPSRAAAVLLSSSEATTTLPTFPTTTVSQPPGSPTTSTAPVDAPATTTTQVVQATTTTTTRDELFELEGGWVKVACAGDRIVFKSAAPQAGYQLVQHEISERSVQITFESEDHTSAFQASCKNGTIDATVEDGHGDRDSDND